MHPPPSFSSPSLPSLECSTTEPPSIAFMFRLGGIFHSSFGEGVGGGGVMVVL